MRYHNPLPYSFGISLLFHLGLVAAISLWMSTSPSLDLSPKDYIELSEERPLPAETKTPPQAPPEIPRERPIPRELTPPRLVERGPEATESAPAEVPSLPELGEIEKILARLPGDLKVESGTPFAYLAPAPASERPEGSSRIGFGPGEAKIFGQPIAGEGSTEGGQGLATRGSEAGAGVLSVSGDVAVIPGVGSGGGGGGTAERGLGMGKEGLSVLTPGGGGMPEVPALPGTSGVFSPTRPLGVRRVMPSYPQSARLAGIEGLCLLRVEVLIDGSVGRVLVERSSGHQDLDRAAKAAVSQWQFSPARIGDRRIKAWVMVPVRFRLSGD